MKTSSRWWLLIACVGLLTMVWCPRAAYADSVTFTGPSTITLTEDGSTQNFSFTLTNPASGTTLFALFPTVGNTSFAGDLSDFPLSAAVGGCLGPVLLPGASCTVGLQISLPSALDDTDADSGTLVLPIVVNWSDNTGAPASATENVTITVCDPGAPACAAAPVPEPSSLLLLSSGLFGLCLCFAWTGARRKVAQA